MSSHSARLSTVPPHSQEAEEHLLSCCLLDGVDVIPRCRSAGLTPASFYLAAHGIIFERLLEMWAKTLPLDLAVLAEELKATKQLDQIGGYAFLTQVSSRIPTTAQAGFFIEKVRDLQMRRDLIRLAQITIEKSVDLSNDSAPLIQELRDDVDRVGHIDPPIKPRSIASFQIPPDNDTSVLLGNRYLNRGDGAVLVSSSGMGKSAMSIQAAVTWSLGKAFFGIQPNGPIRSLIVQAEDSDGDIGEVWTSICAGMSLNDDQKRQAAAAVTVVTDRVHRGGSFIHALKRWIDQHKPDLVWINPLLAFIDGDINDAHDAGHFLREGLNGLNEPARFGYIVVHHTSKPPTAKDNRDRKWNEVMYDMAGSADLTNWARAVLSLRATQTEGEFNLILAKRGRRAGVVKEVEQGAGSRLEVTTTIPLKHATTHLEIPGRKRPMPVIFWEFREGSTEEARPTGRASAGRPKQHTFADFADVFPANLKQARGFRVLHRLAENIKPIGRNAFSTLIEEALAHGLIIKDASNPALPQYYRSAKPVKNAA
jgi:hypothetical protein